MFALLKRLASDRKGVTALEYGVLAAGIVVAVAAVATTIGASLTGEFTTIAGLL